MRVAPNIHLVASGAAGFSLTHPLDCNAWLIETGDGLALFDTGAGLDVAAIVAEIETDGLDPAHLRHVFLTHAHADHSGGAAGLVELMGSTATLHGCRETASRMGSHDETRISLDRARRLGVYPADYRWRGAAVGSVVGDAETITIGRAAVTAFELPGHSDDSCAFTVAVSGTTLLIAGDTVFAGGKVILQDIPNCSVTATLDSIRRLAALEFETFLPGHGLFALRDGRRHVMRARDYAHTGLAPPSFF